MTLSDTWNLFSIHKLFTPLVFSQGLTYLLDEVE